MVDTFQPEGANQQLRKRRMTIYLAEDDHDLRTTLALLLRKDGHEVIESENGIELLTDLSFNHVHGRKNAKDVLVVTDLRMPKAEGLTIIRALHERGRCPRYVLMTAFANAEIRQAAAGLGALAIFDKPFDLDELRGLVRRLAAEEEPADAVTPAPLPSAPATR
ncbi:MAG TPA: response regulator [Polyangia bacterium]